MHGAARSKTRLDEASVFNLLNPPHERKTRDTGRSRCIIPAARRTGRGGKRSAGGLVEAPGATILDTRPPRDLVGRPRSLAEVEKEQIEAALGYTRGHQGRAAQLLGISRKTLWEKRKKYGLP